MNGLVSRERGFNVHYCAFFLRSIWAAHKNDRKRNPCRKNRSHFTQLHARLDVPEARGDIASGSESIADLWKTTLCDNECSGQAKIQHNSTQSHEDRCASYEGNGDFSNSEALENTLEYDPSGQLPVGEFIDRIDRRTADEIEKDHRWKKRWLERKAIKDSVRTARLRKSPATHDLDTPLELVWKKETPPSELVNRGRLFRQRRVGRPPGIDIDTPRVEEPSSWTKIRFDSYVYELARVESLPAPIAEALNRRPGPRIKVESRSTRERGAILHELMHRRLSHTFVEPEICNVAIHFLTRYQMIAKARSILLLMEHLNLAIGPSTYNIFLKAAVHQHDLATFTLILRRMSKFGVRRDSQTVLLLIQCLRSRTQKTDVIRKLELAGTRLKNRLQQRELIASTIKQDIAQFLESGGEPLGFIRRMRTTHKVGWMSTRIGNIIFDEVLKRVHLNAALEILPALEAEGFRPDITTLRSPLSVMCDRHYPYKVADLLDLFASNYNIHPDVHMYTKIWYLAWDRSWLNVSALVFVAACMNGALSAEMRNMLLLSLKINTDLLRTKSSARYGPSYPQPRNPDEDHTEEENLTEEHLTEEDPTEENPWSADCDSLQTLAKENAAEENPTEETPTAYPPLRRRAPIKRPGPSKSVYLSLMGNFILGLNPWDFPAREDHRDSPYLLMMQMIRTLATGRFRLRYSFGYQLREAASMDLEWSIFQGRDVREKLWNPYPIGLEVKEGGKGKWEGDGEGGGVVRYFLHSKMWKTPEMCDGPWFGRPLPAGVVPAVCE